MSSEASAEEPFFYVGNTYPVPSNLYEAITGFKHVKHEDATTLGDETEVIRLEVPIENIKDLLHVIINDILHDSEGARSAKGTRLSDHFNPSSKSDPTENGLNQLIETFLYGMNTFYGNKDADALRIREDACIPPPPKLKRGRAEAEEEAEDFAGGAPTTRSMAAQEPVIPQAPESRRTTRSMATIALPSLPVSRPMTRSQMSVPAPSFVFKALPSRETQASRRTARVKSAPVVKKTAPIPALPEVQPIPKRQRAEPPATAPARAPAVFKSLEQSIVCDLVKTHYGTTQMNIKGVDESKELRVATRVIKQAAYKTKHSEATVKALHTNYTTDTVLKSRKPYLVSYDAGSDLLNSILGQYGYVDISIVNVKDPGDSMRNRNKLHTSIEKIIHQYPSIEWKNLVLQLKSSASHLPAVTRKQISAFLEACQSPAVQRELNINVFYFHNYVATRVSECIKNKCMVKKNTPNILLRDPTPARILDDYKAYIHHKYNAILGKERFVVHKKNIRLIVATTIGDQEFKLIDALYYFDKAHHNRMRVSFRGAADAMAILPHTAYDRPDLNSARDVGLNIKEMNDKLGGILGILHDHLTNPSQSLRTLPVSHTMAAKKIAITLYLECMFKFMGDFGQVLYCFYLGSVFASFDSSAVSVALTVMNILIRNPKIYKAFKEGSVVQANGATKSPGSGFQERMERGLILVTSTKYHGKAVPQVSYFTDYYASKNIQAGSKDLTPEQLQASLVRYFDEIQVERFDASIQMPVPVLTIVPDAPALPPQLELFNETVAITNVRVHAREEKNRILNMVEQDNRDEIKMLLIPQLMDAIAQSATDLQPYKTISNEKHKGVIYIASDPNADLWKVIEDKVDLYMSHIGTFHASRKEHIFKLFMQQLKDYRKPAGKTKTALERIELLEKNRPHGGVKWIFIPNDKRYSSADYLAYYKRHVKRMYLGFIKEPTDEKRERFVAIVDAWFRDVSRLSAGAKSAKSTMELIETADAIHAAAHRLESPSGNADGIARLNELFNIGQPEIKRVRK